MPTTNGDRSRFFPAIEAKHGKPISHWLTFVTKRPDLKYPELIALLRSEYGFSQAHANAVVLYARGSTTSKRFTTFADYLASLDAPKRKTVTRIFRTITNAYPDTEVVIAWNQPMIKLGSHYLFGVSAATNHLLIAPWDQEVLTAYLPRFTAYKVNKKTIQVPVDWDVDEALLIDLIGDSIARCEHP